MLRKRLITAKHFWMFVCPALLVYSVFWILPLLSNIPISLTNWNGIKAITAKNFIGLQNYLNLFSDKVFLLSLQHNIIYTILTLVIKLTLSLAIAVLLDRFVRFKGFLRTVLFFPNILPFIVVSYLWLWIYNPAFGLLNYFFSMVGLHSLEKLWLADPTIALYSITVTSIWTGVPFYMLIFLAGLQGISRDLEEAAQMDGANFWEIMFNVVFPQLKPVIIVVVTLILFDGFRIFENVFVMTNGGPGYHSTEVLSTYIYKTAFFDLKMGYGSAMSIFLMVILLVISAAYFKFVARPND